MSVTTEKSGATAVRPFHVDISDGALEDLRRRIAAARWPRKELVADRSQGVQLATTQELARYWATELRLAQVRGEAERAPAVHERQLTDLPSTLSMSSRGHANTLPVIITHGWPCSVMELVGDCGPAGGGGTAEPQPGAFDGVLPSVPGYGFSGEPMEIGWGMGRSPHKPGQR